MNKRSGFLSDFFPPVEPVVNIVMRGARGREKTENKEPKAAYYSTKELAEVLSLSVGWIEKWRRVIVGARQYGRIWRFDKAMVDARIAKGKDVRITENLTLPLRETHIADVHGAVRSGKKKGNTYGT